MKNPGTLNKYFLYNSTVPYIRIIIAQVWFCYNYGLKVMIQNHIYYTNY